MTMTMMMYPEKIPKLPLPPPLEPIIPITMTTRPMTAVITNSLMMTRNSMEAPTPPNPSTTTESLSCLTPQLTDRRSRTVTSEEIASGLSAGVTRPEPTENLAQLHRLTSKGEQHNVNTLDRRLVRAQCWWRAPRHGLFPVRDGGWRE